MVVNMNMRGSEEGNINQYLSDTIGSVFPSVYTVDVDGSTNRELFASASPDIAERLQQSVSNIPDRELRQMMERVSEEMRPYQAGSYCMTDDKAPVELLGMQVIDELIQEEVQYYKDIFRREGLPGLIRAL